MSRSRIAACFLLPLVALTSVAAMSPGITAEPNTRTERFDRDPGWVGHNNRTNAIEKRQVKQDFGWSKTANAGGKSGEIGGYVSPDGSPAFYARSIAQKTFNDKITASGVVSLGAGGTVEDGAGNTLLGWFNSASLNEWRTPSTIALRLNGRGEVFHVHLEYCTAKWRAGAVFYQDEAKGEGRYKLKGFDVKKPHTWSMTYDPAANNGGGAITATFDGETLVCPLDPGHKADGATFNRFGLLNVLKSADNGGPIWVDDLSLDGVKDTFDKDPGWTQQGNHRTYLSESVRPRFNFGYSETAYAGGKKGEIGGMLYRGDQRYPERMAYYGAKTGELTLEKRLTASGKVTLRRGVTDSTVLFGFFHSEASMKVGPEQSSGLPENFVGATIEGPSREGFLFYPSYAVDRESQGASPRFEPLPPYILPDGKVHEWKIDYSPAAGTSGRLTVTLNGKSTSLDLTPEHRSIGARFDRFGFVTTHIDGNGQEVYLDDVTYTVRQ